MGTFKSVGGTGDTEAACHICGSSETHICGTGEPEICVDNTELCDSLPKKREKQRTKPPRGQNTGIPYLGHKTVKQNPRLRLWNSNVPYEKKSWKPAPVEPWTFADLHRLCTSIRTDHPARKS